MIKLNLNNIDMTFKTEPSLFSPKNIDNGTLAMLSHAQLSSSEKVLDLGCGYGIVGIYAAKLIGGKNVVMLDNDDTAVAIARQNAELNNVPDITIVKSDGFRDLDDTGYTLILSNPPYHTDFSIAKHFIEKGFNRLAIGGRMMMVTKRRAWYENKLRAVFGGVTVREADGYYIFIAVRKTVMYSKLKSGSAAFFRYSS